MPRKPKRTDGGMVLVMALFTMAVLLAAATGALLVGSSDIRATRNYRGAAQVHFAAESGILDAMQTVNGPGVVNFQNEVVNQWTALWGTTARNFGPFGGFTYNVSVVPGANPANDGRFVATANGVEGVKNVVVASVTRSNIPSTAPGAIYLVNDSPTNSTFDGNAFTVDGNDHSYLGGMGTAPPIPGISTRNATNTQETQTSLAAQQKDNVTGLGFSYGPPIVPSVMTSPAAPSVDQMNQIINDILARRGNPPVPPDDNTKTVNGTVTYGTTANPQITHLTNTTGVKLNGNASGAGILIVEGDITIQGDFNFVGLIVVRGQTNVDTGITGNATIYGSLWTEDLNLIVGGSAIVDYSSDGLALANQVSGGAALPAPVKVISLVDCGEVTAGANVGCP
ncbi:MAG: hypothetical protein E6J69_04650 [Deltaproteobacteria bacterium]|nr:MAG: hypothetical protein E6J69_04650 [Deltaproteobacteria bacterium]